MHCTKGRRVRGERGGPWTAYRYTTLSAPWAQIHTPSLTFCSPVASFSLPQLRIYTPSWAGRPSAGCFVQPSTASYIHPELGWQTFSRFYWLLGRAFHIYIQNWVSCGPHFYTVFTIVPMFVLTFMLISANIPIPAYGVF